MRLLRAGVEITVIALWLGHESVATTQICLRADMELNQRALDRTTPPGRGADRAGEVVGQDLHVALLDTVERKSLAWGTAEAGCWHSNAEIAPVHGQDRPGDV